MTGIEFTLSCTSSFYFHPSTKTTSRGEEFVTNCSCQVDWFANREYQRVLHGWL